MTARATPGPWAVWRDEAGRVRGICRPTTGGGREVIINERPCGDAEANAALIVTAVNTHDALVAALGTLNAAARHALFGDGPIRGNGRLSPEYEAVRAACVDASDALRAAGVEP